MSIKRKDCECLEQEVTVAQGDGEESEEGKIPESFIYNWWQYEYFQRKKKAARKLYSVQ